VTAETDEPETHAERLAATRDLLDAAAGAVDAAQRRVALEEVAALNADDALAIAITLSRQQQLDETDEPALLAYALEAYVDAVLTLDPTPDIDVLPQVLPALRDAVVRFNRSLIACHAAPGIGERSGLR
jgi:hypothetical protein